MNRIKYIIISSLIALIVLLVVTYVINLKENETFLEIAIANNDIKEGEGLAVKNIKWIKVDTTRINREIYITRENIEKYKGHLLNTNVYNGQVICKTNLIQSEEFLTKIEGMEYIALPVKSATEGVCYKLKRGDKITVYYTAKKKLVDSVLKDKKKIYSTNTSETLVTCLLYENLEIIAMTNNIGQDTVGATVTDIVVRLSQSEALELANLKDQGTFTLAIK